MQDGGASMTQQAPDKWQHHPHTHLGKEHQAHICQHCRKSNCFISGCPSRKCLCYSKGGAYDRSR